MQGNVICSKKNISPLENEKPIPKKKEEEKFELTEEKKIALFEIIGKENLEKVEIFLEELAR